ncbi:FtsB family cell division protein [Nocardioides cavernaquae]|nr:septum formation initiator family protein [Nocardioides cavernaquae]
MPGARTTLRAAAAAASVANRERPRITKRAVILLLVVAMLAVSWASSFRAWFQQRAEMDDLRSQIAQTQAEIEDLRGEKRRYSDDAYVKQQARLRFGYVMPGEESFQALDENGEPIGAVEELADPGNLPGQVPVAWYETAWESVEAAGDNKEAR